MGTISNAKALKNADWKLTRRGEGGKYLATQFIHGQSIEIQDEDFPRLIRRAMNQAMKSDREFRRVTPDIPTESNVMQW